MNFITKLENTIKKNNSLLCIGLDSDIDKLPKHLLKTSDPIFEFNKAIIDNTNDLVCAYKPNIAFYSSQGKLGLESLLKTIEYIKKFNIPIILDAKRGDVGSTSTHYAKEVFDILKADAVTVNPYLGFDSIEPFLQREDKGIIVLCKTSNPGANDFQDLKMDNEPLYVKVAKKVVEWDKKYKNLLMVVGATYPEELKKIREIAKDMFFLIPGIGMQGGDLENTLKNGLTKEKSGLIISVSRSIIFASNDLDFAEAATTEAQKIKEEINQYR